MEIPMMNMDKYKIFKDYLTLEFKDPKLESWYQNLSKNNIKKSMLILTLVCLVLGTLLGLAEGVLYVNYQESRNLRWNFYFCILNWIITFILLLVIYFKDINQKEILLFTCKFFLHLSLENFFLSLMSIFIVYFKFGIEFITFIFFVKTILKCIISLLLDKSFTRAFITIMTIFLFKAIFLLSIHVIKMIIYYLFMNLAFNLIILSFVYMYEFMTRKFFFSFLKLSKEKEYFLETMSFFNISYFSGRNKNVRQMIKMDHLINKCNNNNKFRQQKNYTYYCIQNIMKKMFMVSKEKLPIELQTYLNESQIKQNFKFKKLVKLLIMNEEYLNMFKKFTSVGVLKMEKEGKDEEDLYLQVFLKFKIKSTPTGTNSPDTKDTYFSNDSNFYYKNNINVKFEGLLLDVTQSYLKKETQTNSFILSKLIHDIKSPLFLLERLVLDYKKHLNNVFSRSIIDPSILNSPKTSLEINDYSNNLKLISKNIFELIESINNFSKKQNNFSVKETKKITKIEVRKIINECVDFYKVFVKFNTNKGNLKVYSKVEGHIPQYIYTDKVSFKQILMNLLSNAIKFTYHGEVKVICTLKSRLDVAEDKKFIEINVIDTGVGIEEEFMNKIGKPFGFIPLEKNRTGLGLSIVTDLLSGLNSKLSFYSQKNKGSNFCFELPIDNKPSIRSLDDLLVSDKGIMKESVDEEDDHEKQINPITKISDGFIDLSGKNIVVPPIYQLDKEDNDPLEDDDNKTIIYDLPFNKKSIYKEVLVMSRMRSYQSVKEINKYLIRTSIEGRSEEFNFTFQNQKYLSYTYDDKFKNKQDEDEIKINQIKHTTKKEINFNLDGFIPQNKNKQISFMSPRLTKHTTTSLIKCKTRVSVKSFEEKFNILLIDDDPTYLKQLAYQINFVTKDIVTEFHIETASDPLDGICKIYKTLKERNEFYDLVFIDENMPFMSGSNFVKIYNDLLCKNGLYKIPFVSVSSEIVTFDPNVKKYFDFFINKPSRKNDIKSLLKKFVDKKLRLN